MKVKCSECGTLSPPTFLVKVDILKRVSRLPGPILCKICFEEALGRPLVKDDLLPVPINQKFIALFEI